MRRLILFSIILLLFCQSARAERDDLGCCPSPGFIGLFANEDHSNWCIYGTGAYTIYLFALPIGDEGMKCVELRTELSSPYIALFNAVFNDDIAEPIMGGVPGDLAACYNSCQTSADWILVFHATLFIMAAEEAIVSIESFTGSPYPKFLTCDGIEIEAIRFTNVYANVIECFPISVKESTWGAIKNMYK